VQDPFDRTRPLWEFVAIDGLPGGRGALLQKMHHTITDGEGGIRMSERLVDLTREADDPAPLEVDEPPTVQPDLLSTTLETFGHTMRRAGGIAERTLSWAAGSVTDPGRLLGLGTEITETARSVSRQLMVTDGARSPLWTHRSLNRHFDTLDVPFDEAKRAAKELGGSLNDFFVAGAAMGAGDYHERCGVSVDELRIAMPVSFRRDKTAGGNAFAPMRVVVPVQGADPAECFAKVRDRLTTTKSEKAIGLVGGVAGLVNLLPTSAVVRFTRQQVEAIDFTTSNVRAAPFDLYISGGRVEGNYPLGPLGGTAFNLTMMSYRGMCNMGLHVDRGAIEDPDLLRRCIIDAYDGLLAAGA
jgi:WS/DGAT/MGAT family acyltransferase